MTESLFLVNTYNFIVKLPLWMSSFACILIIVIDSHAKEVAECAKFSSNRHSSNKDLIFGDMNVIGNSASEYYTHEQVWNTTGTWRVNVGCKLKLCDTPYLNGKCRDLDSGTNSSLVSWASAKCECNKLCDCQDLHLSKDVCARLYHSVGGCTDCHASYTELAADDVEVFSDEWKGNIDSVLVRPGCMLNIYEDEDFEGNALELLGSTNLTKLHVVPGSFKCSCETYTSFARKQELQGDGYPTLMDIPQSLDDVIKMLGSNHEHPGLRAALKSIELERSSKNAYILVLGSSGAGKSSTINILLGNPNATAVGAQKSTTSDIIELRVPVPLPKKGIRNSQLRIIDTPGISDTRGIETDSRFLATLDDYLTKHEELKTAIPNLVLVFHRFDDNRQAGISSQFVRMLKTLNTLREKITDSKFSNVVFVLSHLCSTSKSDQRNPSRILLRFEDIIEKYSLFPKPINIVVIENKGKDNFLPMVMGNYLLPNQEFFPQNLIHKLDVTTQNLNDIVGNFIIKSFFALPKELRNSLHIETVHHHLVSAINPKVPYFFNLMSGNTLTVPNTEVSTLLQQAYDRFLNYTKINQPERLEYLQRYLNLRNIRNRRDIPQTTIAILKLLQDLPVEEDIYYTLLEDGLGVSAPKFPKNLIVGQLYNNLSNHINPATPFNLEQLHRSTSGFLMPRIIDCEKKKPSEITVVEKVTCQSNFSTCTYFYSFSVTRYKLKLKPNSRALPSFTSKFSSLSRLDLHDYYSVNRWKTFFANYGTHVVTSANFGGKLEIQLKIPRNYTNAVQIYSFKKSALALVRGNGLEVNNVTSETGLGFAQHLVFHGGNPDYHITDVSKLSIDEFRVMIRNWKESLDMYPFVFRGDIQLTHEFFRTSWSNETFLKVNEAVSHFCNSTLRYVPRPRPTPDPKVVEREKQKQEENLKRFQEELMRKKEADDKRKRQAQLDWIRRHEDAMLKLAEQKRLEKKAEEKRKKLKEEHETDQILLELQNGLDELEDNLHQTIDVYKVKNKAEEEIQRISGLFS